MFNPIILTSFCLIDPFKLMLILSFTIHLSYGKYPVERNAIYSGDSIIELQKLCKGVNNCSECSIPICTQLMLRDLKVAQHKINAYQHQLQLNGLWYFLNFLGFGLAVLLGSYLLIRKHFVPRCLWDELHPDPTYGMPYWMYVRMEYRAEVVGKKTMMRPNANDEEFEDDMGLPMAMMLLETEAMERGAFNEQAKHAHNHNERKEEERRKEENEHRDSLEEDAEEDPLDHLMKQSSKANAQPKHPKNMLKLKKTEKMRYPGQTILPERTARPDPVPVESKEKHEDRRP